ncbi:sigma-70 family RNA polymerase sigma factor [Christensenellaceae bacterium OttesenSCG-928-M15]|nr:sigma-70 family RNA polymerase sigma factor [Christensenellaceae bacterium OttesenSCG-928-M15]
MEAVDTGMQTLEALYDTHHKTVYWAAFGVLHDTESSKDVMQNVFLSAHRHIATLEGMSVEQQRAWLYRAAVNASIDLIRRNKRMVPSENPAEGRADDGMGPEEEIERSQLRAAVRQALYALPEKYQKPLALYYFAEMDYKAISEALDINEGTLKSRMSRGRALMEKELRKGGGMYAQ